MFRHTHLVPIQLQNKPTLNKFNEKHLSCATVQALKCRVHF